MRRANTLYNPIKSIYHNRVMTSTFRKPRWIKGRVPAGPTYNRLRRLMREGGLHTVCEEAQCPNLGECWAAGTLTIMILGDTCTRSCGFCAVKTGSGGEIDWDEPRRVADAVAELKAQDPRLCHVVITSVNRDDRNMESAQVFAETIARVRDGVSGVKVEVLIPDFKGEEEALGVVLRARPDVLNHNIETVPRLYGLKQMTEAGRIRAVRPQANYGWSLTALRRSKEYGLPGMLTKSGLMVGLGEELDEVLETLTHLHAAGCDIVTVGQYLRPTVAHLPVTRYYHPLEFDAIKSYGEGVIGIPHVEAGPMVRSSYHAEKQVERLDSG